MAESNEQIFSIQEIQDRYDGEWVLVADPITDDSLKVSRGTVLFHSPDRDEVYAEAIRLRPRNFAMLFMGALPTGTAIVL